MLERAENSTSSLVFGLKISDGLNQFVRGVYKGVMSMQTGIERCSRPRTIRRRSRLIW